MFKIVDVRRSDRYTECNMLPVEWRIHENGRAVGHSDYFGVFLGNDPAVLSSQNSLYVVAGVPLENVGVCLRSGL